MSAQLLNQKRLYVGGIFHNISGNRRNSLAVFDILSGNLVEWQVPVIRTSYSYNFKVNQSYWCL
jgi:hypothetical protein